MRVSAYLIVVLAVVGTAGALDFTFRWAGGFAGFAAFQNTLGSDQVFQIYKTCIEKKGSGSIDSTSVECVGHLPKYLFGAAVGTAEGGSGNAQETNVPPPRKRDEKLDLSFLEAINIHLTNVSMPDIRLLATDVVESHVPSVDGVAIRFNVHGDDSTLNVHTNGTHAIATFDAGIHLGRRDLLPTEDHYYEFTGVNGLKMQAHAINTPSNSDYHSDLDACAEHFAISNMQPRPFFQGSDSWDIQVCNKAGTATFFYVKIVAEMDRPGKDFEPMDTPGC